MDEQQRKQPQTSFSGLYKNVKISVKTLDIVIIGGIVVMILLVLFGIANKGFTVSFDSRGGTDVPPQTNLLYGDLLEEPEPPTREGYVFTGWYQDKNCTYPWIFSETTVPQSITLFAGWEPITN